jgi:DNA-binding transcriptional LysR family regulator
MEGLMDRFAAMSVFLAVVDAGSLSAASRRLGMPLATVSRRVADLEAQLNARLLQRSSRRLALTDAGRSYAAAARRILEDLGEAERAAAGEFRAPKGELIVTAPIVFGRLHVLPVTMEFLRAYPEIDVRLIQTDRVIDLMENHVDVAVRIAELPDSGLIAMRFGAIRRVVCGSPAYFAARGMPQSPADLAHHDGISFEGAIAPDLWTLGGAAAPILPARARLVVNTAEAAVDAAVAGLGVTRVLSYQVAEPLRAGRLALALEAFEPPAVPVSFVYTGQRLLPLKLRAFLDFAAPRLKARLAALPA